MAQFNFKSRLRSWCSQQRKIPLIGVETIESLVWYCDLVRKLISEGVNTPEVDVGFCHWRDSPGGCCSPTTDGSDPLDSS